MSDTPALASRSPDMISRWRSAVTAGWRLPSRSRSACATSGQPPWRRCPRTARSPARCAARSPATASAATPSASGWCASRNRSPGRSRWGSDRSGPAAPRPGRTRGREAGRRRAAAGAQHGAPAEMAVVRRSSCSPRKPQKRPESYAESVFSRSQSAPHRKFPHSDALVLGRGWAIL